MSPRQNSTKPRQDSVNYDNKYDSIIISTTGVGIINLVDTSILVKQAFVRHLPYYCQAQLMPPHSISEACIKWTAVGLIDL